MCGSCGSSKDVFSGSNLNASQVWDGNSPYVGCCVLNSGYYCIWDDVSMALECEEWVEACNFRNVLRQVSHISFQVVAERDRARTALNNLSRSAPFEMCKRFPLGKSYVNISCSTYAEILQRILGSLDFKDRESEKEMKYSLKREQDDKDQTARRSYSIDDASTAFRKGLMTLQNELCKRNETYTRWSFEKKYNLKWCPGACPVPSEGGPAVPPPNDPNTRTYNEFYLALMGQGKLPSDFNVFTEEDMKLNKFKCGATLENLNVSMANKRIPDGVEKIYIVTKGEYAKCGTNDEDKINGYWYDVKTRVLHGVEVLKPESYEDFEEFISENFDRVEEYVHKVKRKKYPNSMFGKRGSKVVDDGSSSSFEEVE